MWNVGILCYHVCARDFGHSILKRIKDAVKFQMAASHLLDSREEKQDRGRCSAGDAGDWFNGGDVGKGCNTGYAGDG